MGVLAHVKVIIKMNRSSTLAAVETPKKPAFRRGNAGNMTKITRFSRPGTQITQVDHDGIREMLVTATPLEGAEDSAGLFRRAIDAARSQGGTIVRQEVFGAPETVGEDARSSCLVRGQRDWAVTWIEEAADPLGRPAGTHLHAVSGARVKPIVLDGRVVGAQFENGRAHYGQIADLRPADLSAGREEQARSVFEQLEAAVAAGGMKLSDVIRTWLYLDRILDWYTPFNGVRTKFFKEHKVFDGLVPASTGIGGRNAHGAAIVAGALTLIPKDDSVRAIAIPSPLQCPAPAYGSSFSRAVEIVYPGLRRLFISGTASILPGGETAFVGDVDRQIDLSMKVTAAILESRGMGWADLTRVVAYVRRHEDIPAFGAWCRRNALPPMPAVVSTHDICRDDLLFEIECDAITTLPPPA